MCLIEYSIKFEHDECRGQLPLGTLQGGVSLTVLKEWNSIKCAVTMQDLIFSRLSVIIVLEQQQKRGKSCVEKAKQVQQLYNIFYNQFETIFANLP